MGAAFVFVLDILMQDACLKVLGQKADSQLVQSCASCDDLLKDVQTSPVGIHHLLQSVELPRDSRQPPSRVVLQLRLHSCIMVVNCSEPQGPELFSLFAGWFLETRE